MYFDVIFGIQVSCNIVNYSRKFDLTCYSNISRNDNNGVFGEIIKTNFTTNLMINLL